MKQRTYHVVKKGKRVPALLDSVDGMYVFKEFPTYDTLDASRIFSVDTESLKSYGELKTLLTTMHFDDSSECIETPEGEGMLSEICSQVIKRFGVEMTFPSNTKQRAKKGKIHGRNGRRTKIPPVLSVWFNLQYDFGRIASDTPEILRSTLVGADSFCIRVNARYEVEVVRMHFGSSSSFEWYIRDLEDKLVVRMLGLDLTGYWKTTLSNACKATGVSQKHEIDGNWFEKPREEFTHEQWEVFKAYGVGDVKSTLELYHATVLLLQNIDVRVVRKNGVIPPSAPGAAARIVFAMAFDLNPWLTKESGGCGYWQRPPTWVDQYGADAYYGGRVFCVAPGVHHRMITLDIKSAYPYAMACLPDPVTATYEFVPECEFDFERFKGLFGVLYIDGEGLNDKYPALRMHDAENHRLKYVVGKFENHAATIAEVVMGVFCGTLRVDRIRQGVIMRGDAKNSFLRAGIQKFFNIKNDATRPKAQRDMAKLLANSTYGKFVEVNERDYSIFEDMLVPDFAKGREVARTIARIYAELGKGFNENDYWGDSDVQEEEAQRTYLAGLRDIDEDDKAFFAVVEYVNALGVTGARVVSHEMVHLGDYLRKFTRYHCGQYFLPLLASQVTGLTSATVGLAAFCLNALQGDTDSVHLVIPEGMTSCA